jgi:hypothetical protein
MDTLPQGGEHNSLLLSFELLIVVSKEYNIGKADKKE